LSPWALQAQQVLQVRAASSAASRQAAFRAQAFRGPVRAPECSAVACSAPVPLDEVSAVEQAEALQDAAQAGQVIHPATATSAVALSGCVAAPPASAQCPTRYHPDDHRSADRTCCHSGQRHDSA
jgi:hypothetical protein